MMDISKEPIDVLNNGLHLSEAMKQHPDALWTVAALATSTSIDPREVRVTLEELPGFRQSPIPTREGHELYASADKPIGGRELWVTIRQLIAKRPY